ncbi:hypothetical protein CASFOL_012737 [Castilleja foliolosa]|uniref:Uncharacterized protein n=1 Tax=Castilleja foliolosa TaxID=1961234 RepID=A0ABD3DIP2_9LAMI
MTEDDALSQLLSGFSISGDETGAETPECFETLTPTGAVTSGDDTTESSETLSETGAMTGAETPECFETLTPTGAVTSGDETMESSETLSETGAMTGAETPECFETLTPTVAVTSGSETKPVNLIETLTPPLSPAIKRAASLTTDEPAPKRATLDSPQSLSAATTAAAGYSSPCPPNSTQFSFPTIPTTPDQDPSPSQFPPVIGSMPVSANKTSPSCAKSPNTKVIRSLGKSLEHEATVSENCINDNNQKETESLFVQKDGNGLSIDVKCPCEACFVLCYAGNDCYTLSHSGKELNNSSQKFRLEGSKC